MTLAALGEIFQAARAIMSWLGDCAKVCLLFVTVGTKTDGRSESILFICFFDF